MNWTPARRLQGIQESIIREMTRLALKHNAINLSQGLPDFPPPPEVLDAAHQALDEGYNQYSITWGLPETRTAIAQKVRRFYGVDVDPEHHVTVTCGVSEAIMAAVFSVVNPGDEVILFEPAHENFVPAIRFAGGRPVFIPLLPPSFELDENALRRAFSPRTRAILVNTPHNPTGKVFSQEELRIIGELAETWNTVIITDEIYEHIVYDGRRHVSPLTLMGLEQRVISLGGLSKTYAMTGWRLGYAISLNLTLSTALRTVHDYLTICAPTPLQKAAIVALNVPNTYYDNLIREYTERRAVMMRALHDAGFIAHPPQGAYYVLADFQALRRRTSAMDFARWLTKTVGVAVVPGTAFYYTPGLGETTVRFAFPKRVETLEEAGRRLRRVATLLQSEG